MDQSPTPTRHWLVSYHGLIALMGCIILLISNGMALTGLTPFRQAFKASFGWTQQQINLSDLITFGVVGLLAPILGIWMDRTGVKRMIMAGGVLLALCYWLLGKVTTLQGLYGVHALFGVAIALSGLVPASRLIGRWFHAARGAAMGIALAGSSLAVYVFAPLAKHLIENGGTTYAFNQLAIAGFILTGLVALFVVDRPEDRGLSVYGWSDQQRYTNEADLPGADYKTAISSLSFVCLALGASMTFFAMLGTLYNLVAHMIDLKFDLQAAIGGLQLMLLAAFVGKFVFGAISDYLKPKHVYLVNLAVMALGALLLARADASNIKLAAIIFGLGWGGLYTMLQLLAVESFGLKSAAKLLGTIAVFDAIGGGLGSYVMGVIRTQMGSYQPAFYLVFGMIMIAMIAATQIRKLDGVK